MGIYRVTVGDVPMGGSRVAWPFMFGGKAGTTNIVVDAGRHEDLKKKTGEVSIKWEQSGSLVAEVKRLSVTEVSSAGAFERVTYTLADRRARLANIYIDKTFNHVKRTNERAIPGGNLDPNIALFAAYPKRSFNRATCRDSGVGRGELNQRFATGLDDNFEPWTALQALKYLCSEAFLAEHEATEADGSPFDFGAVDFSKAVENKYVLKNWNPRTVWPRAAEDLMRKAHVALYVDKDGGFVIASLKPNNAVFDEFGKYAGSGGVPFVKDLTGTAPRKSIIHFRKRWEIRFDYSEQLHWRTTKSKPRKAKSIDLNPVNVFVSPNPVGTFQRSQYVPAADLVEAWDNDTDPANNPGTGAQRRRWRLSEIRNYVLKSSLAHYYSLDFNRPGFKNEILEARVAEIYGSYRRLFQIPIVLLDLIEDLDDDSVEIVETLTGRRQLSPVCLDFTSWDSVRMHHKKGSGSDGTGQVRSNSIYKKDLTSSDVSGRKFEELRIGPARMVVKDPVLGIVELQFTQKDLKNMTVAYDPFLIDQTTIPTWSFVARNKKAFTQSARMSPTWRLSFKLTLRFRTGSKEARFLSMVEDDPSKHGVVEARGPTSERVFTGFEAGYAWTHGQRLEIDNAVNQLKVIGGKLVNEGAIKDTAEGLHQQTYFDFRPRILGIYAAAGWTGTMPQGQVSSSTLSYDGGGVLQTVISAPRPEPKPALWDFIDPEFRDLLFKLPSEPGGKQG